MASQMVTPAVVRWALEESGYSDVEVADRIGSDEAVIRAWADGSATPSGGDVDLLSDALVRPPALFFLPDVPEDASLPTELRCPKGAGERELRPAERLALRAPRRIQELVSVLRRDCSATVPSCRASDDARLVGAALREWALDGRPAPVDRATDTEARHDWSALLERRGLFVMSLPLGADGVRGFALHDSVAPVVVANSDFRDGSRTFAVWHEVAHIALGQSVSCLPASVEETVERWCDEVAAQVLIPPSALAEHDLHLEPGDALRTVRSIARRFHCGPRAAALALARNGDSESGLYRRLDAEMPGCDAWRDRPGDSRTRVTQRQDELGRLAARTVIDAWRADDLPEYAAMKALDLDGFELRVLAELCG